jgi:hypothetical protein
MERGTEETLDFDETFASDFPRAPLTAIVDGFFVPALGPAEPDVFVFPPDAGRPLIDDFLAVDLEAEEPLASELPRDPGTQFVGDFAVPDLYPDEPLAVELLTVFAFGLVGVFTVPEFELFCALRVWLLFASEWDFADPLEDPKENELPLPFPPVVRAAWIAGYTTG